MVWQIPDAVDTGACAPDDGRRYHPKHVEQFPDINKLCNIASCWIYIWIYLRCTDPWTLNLRYIVYKSITSILPILFWYCLFHAYFQNYLFITPTNTHLTYKNKIVCCSNNFGVIYDIFIQIYTKGFKPDKIQYITDVIPLILPHSCS